MNKLWAIFVFLLVYHPSIGSSRSISESLYKGLGGLTQFFQICCI